MPVYSFEDPRVEAQGLDELEQWRSRQNVHRSRSNASLADRIAAIARAWPDIPPGAIVGMAMSGLSPFDDMAQQVAQRAVEQRAGLGFQTPGEVASSREIEARQERERSDNPILAGFRTGVRGAFMGMETAREEISRGITAGLVGLQDPTRTVGEAWQEGTPSMGRLLASDEFEFADLGEGFVPSGAVRERQEELKQRMQFRGTWMSPGRAMAVSVTEPGTRPFKLMSGLLDAATAIFADPSTYALLGVGKVRQASKAFATDSALIRGIRRSTDQEYAQRWVQQSPVAQRLVKQLADDPDPYNIWTRLGGPQGKVDRETARLLAAAPDEHAIREVLMPRLGPQGIAEKPVGGMLSRGVAHALGAELGQVHGMGIYLRRGADNVRMLQWMPDRAITPNDPDRAMITIDRFMKGAKFSRDERASLMSRAFRLGADEPGATESWLDFAKDLAAATSAKALKDSIPEGGFRFRKAKGIEKAQELAGLERVFDKKHGELINYFTREAGRPRGSEKVLVGGREMDYSQIPHLATEYLSNNIPLPDMKLVRRHIGPYAKAMRALGDLPRGPWEGTVNFLEGFMTSLWKPMVLLRGAYISRVIGEEQVRMAASGLDSAFRHPISYIAWLGGRRGGTGVSGDLVADMAQFQAIAQRKGGGHIGRKPGQVGTEDWVRVRRGERGVTDQQFARAYADDLGKILNDDVSQVVARLGPDGAKDFWWSGPGVKMRRQVAEAEHNRGVWRSKQAADDYIDSVWLRIEEKTRGNSDLIQAIATGRLDGKMVRWNGPIRSPETAALQRGLLNRLDDIGIQEVSGARLITTQRRTSSDHALLDQVNNAVDFAADVIMSKPTNTMSRFQTWKQAYVRGVEQQLGFMPAETQQAVIRWAAREANLTRSQVRRMERTAKAGSGSAVPDVETADLIARGIATRDTRKLLYELTELGQFSDASRAAIPFAEAWKEIGVAWGRIVRERPHILRRGQQVVEGARGAGFFWTDENGEEQFSYPGGKFVSRALLSGAADSRAVQTMLGVPGLGALTTAGLGVAGAFMDEQEAEFDLTGRVTGLNLFAGSVFPGLGPTVTIPAAKIVPDRPSWDWVRNNIIFPFGEPDTERGIAGATLPAWAQKFRTAWFSDPDTDRVYANSVFDVAKALLATGNYSTDSPEEVDRLMTVAKQKAKGLWLIRGAAQFVVPTGPSARFQVKDLEGQWWPYQIISTEYHRLQQEHGEDEAVTEFLGQFGPDLIALVQSKSRTLVPRPTTQVGDDWIRDNPDLVKAYPLTVGLVAPDDPTGEFNFNAYHRQFAEGAREQLTPQQMIWLSNNLLGRFAYAHQVELVGDGNDTASRQARAQIRAQLTERFPGFNSHLGLRERPQFEDQLRELERMAANPNMRDNPAVRGMIQYLAARNRAEVWTRATAKRSTTFTRSAETRWIRDWLRREAEQIAGRYPEFIPLFERVFTRELAEDDEPVAPGEMVA